MERARQVLVLRGGPEDREPRSGAALAALGSLRIDDYSAAIGSSWCTTDTSGLFS